MQKHKTKTTWGYEAVAQSDGRDAGRVVPAVGALWPSKAAAHESVRGRHSLRFTRVRAVVLADGSLTYVVAK